MSAQPFGPVVDQAGRTLDQIRLMGLEARGHHGVFEHERRDGQTFRVDVVVHLDTRPAARGDELAQTVDYSELAERVVGVLSGPAADLVETVAERIAATALDWPTVAVVDVALHKPDAPLLLAFDDVVVVIRRDRVNVPVVSLAQMTADAQREVEGVPALVEPLDVVPLEVPALEPLVQTGEVPFGEPVIGAVPGLHTHGGIFAATGVLPVTPAAVAVEALAPLDWGTPSVPVPALEVDPEPSAALLREPDRLDEAPSEPVDVVLAIGSNIGASQETLRNAVAELDALDDFEVVEVSPLARTAPVGGPDQPDFLNAVVLARTTLAPRELLHATQRVEQDHGRERSERWGPRTLDIDLVVYGAVLAVTDDLELPHPRAHERAFVLQPWAQVAPDAVLPGLGGGPVAALAATAPDRDGLRWMALDWLTATSSGT